MPKNSTIRKWSHSRLRRNIHRQVRGSLSEVFAEMRRGPANDGKLALDKESEAKALAELSAQITADLTGPGLNYYKALTEDPSFKEVSTEDIIRESIARHKQ